MRSRVADFLAHWFEATFRCVRSTVSGKTANGVRSGVVVKQRHIGRAAASYCDIGDNPRISSMVRSTDVVEYIV